MFINVADTIIAVDTIGKISKSNDWVSGKNHFSITIEYKNCKSSVLGYKNEEERDRDFNGFREILCR